MKPSHLVPTLLGMILLVKNPPARDERGLSQSAENAILLAGAVGIAIAVIAAIRAFVLSRLPG